MKGKKICKKCGEKITPEQKGTLLLTFKGEENLEKVYFHFDCFLKWRDKSLDIRAKRMFNDSMQETMKMFKGLNNARIQYRGTSKKG